DRKYLLSPQDLAGLEVLPELIRAGVASLKIEGRLKSPEYVANITRIYRKALDQLGAAQRAADTEPQPPATANTNRPSPVTNHQLPVTSHQSPITRPDRYDMEMAFSRGLY